MGTIYLIHFSSPLHHARHYLGYVDGEHESIESRLVRHRAGHGAKLLAHLNSLGIGYELVRTFTGDRALERRMKVAHKTSSLCPICRERTLAKLREQKRALRARAKDRAETTVKAKLEG